MGDRQCVPWIRFWRLWVVTFYDVLMANNTIAETSAWIRVIALNGYKRFAITGASRIGSPRPI